jgi:hypothetical protein
MARMTASDVNAIELLKDDHEKVKGIFEQFEETDDQDRKQELARQAIRELKIHSAIEEEIFYPAVRQETDEKEIVDEAEEEHHVVKLLISELEDMEAGDEKFDAKFNVLAENVRHHIRQEEGEMMPNIPDTVDLEKLGAELAERKEELTEDSRELDKAAKQRKLPRKSTSRAHSKKR